VNIKQLSYFVAIAEQGSFVKASAVLHISQPSVSSQIKLLEEELGIQLLERRPDGVVLTLEGKDFLQHAYTILRAVDAARDSIRAYQTSEVGRVAVGMPNSVSAVLAVSLVDAVQRQLPNVQIRLVSGVSGQIQKWVMNGELDFGLVYADGQAPGADIQNLLVEDLYLAAQREEHIQALLTPGGELPMRKLGALPIALPSTAHGLRRIIERAAAAAGINLQVKTEIDPSEQLKQMVRKTGCFTILSLAALQDEAKTPLAIARIVDPPIQRVISILHVTGRPLSRAARRVENVLLEIISEEVKKGWWRPARSSGLDKRQTDNDLTNI
jgi:LysR family nitrogen assimilation transcriptional regulator